MRSDFREEATRLEISLIDENQVKNTLLRNWPTLSKVNQKSTSEDGIDPGGQPTEDEAPAVFGSVPCDTDPGLQHDEQSFQWS
jgi:hypothetical protein